MHSSTAAPGANPAGDLAQKIAAYRRRVRLEAHRNALQESDQEQLSLTTPDARTMPAGTGVGVGCNLQIAVDAKHKLIAEQQVHGQVSDLGLLAETPTTWLPHRSKPGGSCPILPASAWCW